MPSFHFKVFIEPDENGGYVVSCPSLPGCYSQGATIEEALKNIKEAIALCLEDMVAEGKHVPNPSDSIIATVMVDV